MAVIASDLKQLRSAVVSNDNTNGGRMGLTEVGSGVAGALFPNAGDAERAAGSTKYRKAFLHNQNAANDVGVNAIAYIENYTPGDDDVMFFEGTQVDTQAAITGTEDLFGCAQLNSDITATDTSIEVVVHDWANFKYFRNGGLIRISDKDDINAVGNTEFIYIHAVTALSAVGNVVTIPLANPVAGNYIAANTRVSSCLEYGDLEPTADNWAETTVGGSYDEATYPVGLDNQGSIEQIWTLTFDDATNFTVTGDTVGSVGAGSIGADFSPNNPDYSSPYFTLEQEGFGGSWLAGETIVFHTHPASIPLWFQREIPAACAAQASNSFVTALKVGG